MVAPVLNGRLVGYARVSTDDQDKSHQPVTHAENRLFLRRAQRAVLSSANPASVAPFDARKRNDESFAKFRWLGGTRQCRSGTDLSSGYCVTELMSSIKPRLLFAISFLTHGT
jgi:hypothetical protein